MLSYGSAKMNVENIRTVGYLSGVRIKKEFSIHKNYAIVSGLDINNFFQNGGDFHFETNYVSLPVSFRAKMKNGNSTLYAEFGGALNYQYKFKSFDNAIGLEEKQSGLGSSIGLFYKAGYKYEINPNLKFNLALFSGADVLSNFKSNAPESEIDNCIGIELGLAFIL
jgi:hypothetical protein